MPQDVKYWAKTGKHSTNLVIPIREGETHHVAWQAFPTGKAAGIPATWIPAIHAGMTLF